jgi:ABC-2 type transport system ATP-binding protein
MSREPAVHARGLTKRYGDLVAVDHLELRVERGEVFGLLGPNGAGKTTTILMLLGLTEPSEGQVTVLGTDPTRDALAVKRRIGYVPDDVGFYEDMTARQNLRYSARLNRLEPGYAAERIEAVLADVGLAERGDDKVKAYSRGMRQRLGIADALLKEPELLILDEPTIAVDPEGVEEILALIRSLPADRGVTVLLSSHLLQQVQAVCDRIGIFVGGRMVAVGTIDELARRHGGRLVIEVEATGGDVEPVVEEIPEVVDVDRDGDLVVVAALADVREEIARRLRDAGLLVRHLRTRPEELGAIYRRYFTGEAA